ncbi:MAG TPA: VOC family protein [Candidatus Limnocylindrales bacterium]|nr:VOC family protein [Candidatus Limnocylindrales bacterium]
MTASGGWPEHLRVGAFRIVRSSANFDSTISFYRDLVGLRVVDEFRGSYGEDGTIFGLPGTENHLEIVRAQPPGPSIDAFDQLVFYLPDQAAVDEATARLAGGGVRPDADQHPYWDENGGVTFRDPDGRGVIYVSWVYGRDPQPSDAGHRAPWNS